MLKTLYRVIDVQFFLLQLQVFPQHRFHVRIVQTELQKLQT